MTESAFKRIGLPVADAQELSSQLRGEIEQLVVASQDADPAEQRRLRRLATVKAEALLEIGLRKGPILLFELGHVVWRPTTRIDSGSPPETRTSSPR